MIRVTHAQAWPYNVEYALFDCDTNCKSYRTPYDGQDFLDLKQALVI